MPCNVAKCKAICCTYTVFHWPIRSDEIRKYFDLHGIECVNDDGGGLWLKAPLPCKAFDPDTLRCKIYIDRPNACRIYPTKPSPFIPKELCSALKTVRTN